MGGSTDDGDPQDSVERFEPGIGKWREIGPFASTALLVAGVVDGHLYAIDGLPPVAATWKYNAAADTWTRKQDAPVALLTPTAAVAAGRVHVFSMPWEGLGFEALAYDPDTDSWGRIADPPEFAAAACATAAEGNIYLIGGMWDATLAAVQEYDPETGSWTPRADMPTARRDLSCVTVGGLIYALGGINSEGVAVATVEVYDPRADRWWSVADMPVERWLFATVALGPKIYAIGGKPLHGRKAKLDRVDVYDTGATNLTVSSHGKLTTTWGAMKHR
jgi:N-acetylneuraminic acid mutarotase